MDGPVKNGKIKLIEINSYLTCYLCKGYLIDATTISECLHSFCRSCIIKFLQENSHCPVCEVMINKAKPNIKLDKTLQDIVYKLVPELFLREMGRRQRFYRDYPVEAAKATPEERGEDTERTIFSPSDTISLSIEYISDDSTPGAIVVPLPSSVTIATTTATADGDGGGVRSGGGEQDSAIKRYLQCPGMCRVDVLKKFVRNKYNVDTNRFYIDILYKKVPLPDHYTLIDIAYIYSWKRNEPMKFFFRITDINTVTERFDYLGPKPVMPAEKRPAPVTTTTITITTEEKPAKAVRFTVPEKKNRQNATRRTTSQAATEVPVEAVTKKPVKNQVTTDVPVEPVVKKVKNQIATDVPVTKKAVKSQVATDVHVEAVPQKAKKNQVAKDVSARSVKPATKRGMNQVATEVPSKRRVVKDEVVSVETNKEITEIKNRIQKEPLSEKSSVYTNITLNRSNNVEIITKIQKVSNKNGQPIGLNIIKQTVKKSKPVVEKPKVEEEVKKGVEKEEKVGAAEAAIPAVVPPSPVEPILPAPVPMEVDLEKSNFLKSIELTAKNSLPAISPRKVVALESPSPPPLTPPAAAAVAVKPSSSSHQKRKNPSPVKSDRSTKKAKVLKVKTIPNLAVRQMVSNVNQSATNVTKIVERNAATTAVSAAVAAPSSSSCSAPNKDLQTLFDNCKINIPASLSITLKESNSDSDGERRTAVPVKPVQNYIEILRLPDANNKDGGDKNTSDGGAVKNNNNNSNKNSLRSPQTFQKMFEETIKKPEFAKLLTVQRSNNKREQKTALDLSGSGGGGNNSDVKRTRKDEPNNGKVAVVKKTKADGQQQSVDCHSPSLGMNYKVSVGRQNNGGAQSPSKVVVSSSTVSPPNKPVLPKPTSTITTTVAPPTTNPNQLLLEKYNIQNLAQLTASFNLNTMMINQAEHQYAALQQAMILKHFEMQNRQNWLNMNPSPVVQFEKYLQSLQNQQSHLVGKEN